MTATDYNMTYDKWKLSNVIIKKQLKLSHNFVQ